MPIYEYQCPKCGNIFEEWVHTADAHEEEPCPVCKTPSPRIISRTSFVLKGGGWYVSDYGYRKGITEDENSSSKSPAKATPTVPAQQTDKTIATKEKAAPPAKTETSASSDGAAAK